jgi:hypothetical protein
MYIILFILFAIQIITLMLLGFFFFYVKSNLNIHNDASTFRQFVKHVVLSSREISDKFTFNNKSGVNGNLKNQLETLENKMNGLQIKMNQDNVNMFEDKLQKLDRQFGDLQEKVNNLSKSSDIDTKNKVVENIKPENEGIKYFRSKQGRFLLEEVVNESEGAFKVFDIKGNEARFEYCGGVVNSDFFTDICSFENNPADIPNKIKIKTIIAGVVKKDHNSNWEVYTPAKIKFE